MIEISIIIPTYKPQKYIFQCLESLRSQSFSNEKYEVLIILNGCREPYLHMIEEFINMHMQNIRIRVFQIDTAGVSNARNVGLNNAKGRFIAFVDDDDYVSDSYLQELYEIANDGFIPLSNMIAFEDISNQSIPYYLSDAYKSKQKGKVYKITSIRKWFSVPVCKLIPKGIIENRRFDVELRNGEDCLFMFYVSDKMSKFKLTSSNAIYYRRCRESSANFTQTRKMALNNLLILFPKYLKIYFSSPLKYNFLFLFSRLVAIIINVVRKY